MNNKKIWISYLLFLVALVLYAVFYTQLPEQIDIHFGVNGKADGYAPKIAFLGLLGFLILIHSFTVFMIRKDPKYQNMPSIMVTITYFTVPLISIVVTLISIIYSLGYDFNTTVIISMIIGILFIFIGNYLPKVKQNYTMGIKTPWTLNDEIVWNKTHRIGGVIFFIAGIYFLITPLFFNIYILIAIIVVMLVVPFVYSYLLYQKRHKH